MSIFSYLKRYKTIVWFCIVALAVMLTYYIKDIHGMNQAAVYDIRDHYNVVHALLKNHTFIPYKTGAKAMFVPPFMHLLTGFYAVINKPLYHVFNFYTYRDYSYILWLAVLGLYGGLLFGVLYLYSRKTVPIWIAAGLGYALAVSASNYDLFRWYGFMQFLGLVALAVVVLALCPFLARPKGAPSVLLLVALFFLASINHYTTACILVISLAAASALGAVRYRHRCNEFIRTVLGSIILAGGIAVALAVALFYRLLFTSSKGSWGKHVKGSYRVSDLFSAYQIHLSYFLHTGLMLVLAVALLCIAVASCVFARRYKTQTLRMWQTFIVYFISSIVAVIILMNVVALFVSPGSVMTGAGLVAARRTAIGLLFVRSSLFLPCAIALLSAGIYRNLSGTLLMRRTQKYVIPVLTILTAVIMLLRISALRTDYYSINPAYPYVLSAVNGSKNINLTHILSSEMPAVIPLQKSPAATFIQNDLVTVWPRAAINTAVGVQVMNSRNQAVLRWSGIAHEQIVTLGQLQHVAPGVYSIQAYQIDPVTKRPYDTTTVQGYTILGPVRYGVDRFVAPILFVSVLGAISVWLFNVYGERKRAPGSEAAAVEPSAAAERKA